MLAHRYIQYNFLTFYLLIVVSIPSVIALLLSAVSVFSIYGVPSSHVAVVIVSCLFSAVSVTVFGALDVVNTVYYDANLR